MKKIISTLFLLAIVVGSNAQILPPEPPPPPLPVSDTTKDTIRNEKVKDAEEEILEFVEVEPEFPGGFAALMKYLSMNIIYPPIAQEMGVQGNVYIQFIVDKTGLVKDVKIVRGVDPAI